jgi:hypothetical protein
MARREIVAQIGPKVEAFVSITGKNVADGFRNKIVFRSEMAIKPSVGETGSLHYFRHAHRIEASLTEQPAGDVQNPAAIFRHLLFADLHFEFLRTGPLTQS